MAGDTELFFAVIRLFQSKGIRDCLNDPTIFGILQDWEKEADSVNETARKNARSLLKRIGTELAWASYTNTPSLRTKKERQEQKWEAVKKSKGRTRINKDASFLMGQFRKVCVVEASLQHAYERILQFFCEDRRRTNAKRNRETLEKFDELSYL